MSDVEALAVSCRESEGAEGFWLDVFFEIHGAFHRGDRGARLNFVTNCDKI